MTKTEAFRADFKEGFKDGYNGYQHGEPFKEEPAGKSEDYLSGFRCGAMQNYAYCDGWDAFFFGRSTCPFDEDGAMAVFRNYWAKGYMDAVKEVESKLGRIGHEH